MGQPSTFETLIQLANGYTLSRTLHVIANLGVADAIDDSPRTAAELAEKLGADAGALARILRLLSAHGVFEMQDGRFGHTAMSRLLRADHPRSLRPVVQMLGLPLWWKSYETLEHSVRTGRTAAEQVVPEGAFAYFRQHPEESKIFNAAMAARSHGLVAAAVGAYDFSHFGLIGDIGGGRGQLLRAVLDAAPNALGVLFDLPHVIREAEGQVPRRTTLQAGDFFKDPLPRCDAYLLMQVIHDWDDVKATTILSAVRRAAPPGAKMLVIETLVSDDPGPQLAKVLDVTMLALTGGRERTRREYETLFAAADFRLERVIQTASIDILESAAV
jgi:O-methyltransferase/methyltransferase family protein